MTTTYTWDDIPDELNSINFEANFRSALDNWKDNMEDMDIRLQAGGYPDYIWDDAAARAAQTGMSEDDRGFQKDNGGIYRYESSSWVLKYYTFPAGMYSDGTNFGFGTVAPVAKVDINNSLRVGNASGAAIAYLDSAAAGYSDLGWYTAGDKRWILEKSGAESGSNVGGDLFFYRYDDAGAYLGSVLTLKRSTGFIGVNGTPAVPFDVYGVANENTARFRAATSTDQSFGPAIYAGTSTLDYAFYIANAANTVNYVYVDGVGKVGIGCTPLTDLHLYAPNATFRISSEGSGYAYDLVSRVASPYNFELQRSGTALVSVGPDGKVGIGKTPIRILDVEGSLSGQYAGGFYNTSATGHGLFVKGGAGVTYNALAVDNQAGTGLFSIDGNGLATFRNETQGLSHIILNAGNQALANNGTITNYGINTAALISVTYYIGGTYYSGLFHAGYQSTTITEISDLTGGFEVTDTGSTVAIYKDAASTQFTVKNRTGGTIANIAINIIELAGI